MEEESVVHGQLVQLQETDSDTDSVSSRLSLVVESSRASQNADHDASSDDYHDVGIDLADVFDTRPSRIQSEAETVLDQVSYPHDVDGVDLNESNEVAPDCKDDPGGTVSEEKIVFRTSLPVGGLSADENGNEMDINHASEMSVFETDLTAVGDRILSHNELDANCIYDSPSRIREAYCKALPTTKPADGGNGNAGEGTNLRQESYRISPDVPDICNVRPDALTLDIGDVHVDVDQVTPEDFSWPSPLVNSVHPTADVPTVSATPDAATDVRPGSIGHLLQLVRALAHNLPASVDGNNTSAPTASGGLVNLGFEDHEILALGCEADDQDSDGSSNEEIDWSWLADEAQLCSATSRPSSWLRASMRRVRRFALGEPQPRVASAPVSLLPPTVQATIVPARHSAPQESRSQPAPFPGAIPDIVDSVQSRLAPSTATAPSADDVDSIGQQHTPDGSPVRVSVEPLPVPSAPPESPVASRSPDDFPRRYSMLGRLDSTGRRTEAPPEQQSEPATEDESASDCESTDEKEDRWPHSLSSLLSGLGCTLGLFNVSRFAILSVHFGANFVVQFLVLSTVIGWPLYVLHGSLGQHLKAGVVDMWRISPLFQGIGIALLLSQAMLGLYSVVGVAWLFTYFRDSFINKYDAYRWAENGTRLQESVSEYLNVVVLQREGIGDSSPVGHLKFQVTFNLAVVWMIVFVCLSKGIKSYGKSVYLFGIVPIMGIAMLTIKMLSITDVWFDHTAWSELFNNTNCWTAAAIECFTTWGLLGAATMQMRSHSGSCRLPREVIAVGLITVATLVSAALLANGFSQLLRSNDLRYVPSSFENEHNTFLMSVDAPRLSSTPTRWMSHGHFVVGVQVTVPGSPSDSVSGYQVAPFATELAPAVFAKLGAQAVSPFWTVLFYFTLILLGISQQLCIWHCVITGVMAINISRLRSWETTITFLSCACGFVLGLPMTTELGVWVVYFMDYCVGGGWWLVLLQVALVVAALMALGGEQVAQTLLGTQRSLAQAIVVFTWNVVLPVSLTVTSVAWFKANGYRDLYTTRHHGYWPAWARRVGCLLQLLPLILVPVVSAIQTWRYLTNGPADLFDRLRLLCRPGSSSTSTNPTSTSAISAPSQALPELTPLDDPPPKYTPPPSYATATGARIAKLLRRSFRRLVGPSVPSPPDYSAVLVEMGGAPAGGRSTGGRVAGSTLSALEVAHILRSSMRRTLRREQARSTPSAPTESSKAAPVI